MITSRPVRAIVSALVILGLMPAATLPAYAFTGGVTTVYRSPTPDTIERARTFAAKTPELDQTYQRTMRSAASKVAVASALRRALRGFVEKLPLIGAIAILASDLYGIWRKNADGSNDLVGQPVACGTQCKEYSVNGSPWNPTPAGACTAWLATISDPGYSYGFVSSTEVRCTYKYTDNKLGTGAQDGATVISRISSPNTPQPPYAISDAELETALKADKPFIPILRQMDDLGQPVDFPSPEVEDIPQSIVINPTTKTRPDGSKAITQVRLDPYRDEPDGPIYWRKREFVTEVSKPAPDGTTTSTTSTTTTDTGQSSTPEKSPEAPATDTALPAQPKLYKQKYPDGITGVWQASRDVMANSSLFTIAKTLMPTVGLSGSCPTMPVNLNFSQWANFGTKDVAPPCQVWDWGRAICIVSACLLARRLIFGG